MSVAIGDEINTWTLLEVTVCVCGVKFAVPDRLLEVAREGQRSIYCPSCRTSLSWEGQKREEKLREQLVQERNRAGRLAAERDQAEASRRAQKAATTRAKKRHASGVCPACKRTFQNVQRHMASQHPDYDPSESVPA